MNVVFAGGGTGGHLYPAIALADALRGRAKVRFIGTADRLEAKIVPDAGYELVTISSRPLQRSISLATLQTAGANALGVAQALGALREFQPDVVVATGGYVCFPVMIAAKLLRTLGQLRARLALLEPNAQPGLTNRLLAPLVDEVWGAFEQSDSRFAGKYAHTGIPVRASLFHPSNRIEAARRLGLDPARKTILVVGGSQGARTINETVAALVTRRALPAEWQILHASGERDYDYMQAEERAPLGENRIVLVPYLREMADAYELADLVIARAGASTLGELAALGLPSILVPYPFASEDHQAANAKAFESANAAVVIADRDLNADSLWWTLRETMEPARLQSMRDAARSLAARDPVATILARIDALVSRKGAAA
ncbi:MAG TPA: undecaprenyldiphospho-muramoylpentapeptide beta-N-acetylglucosaminyltransferase [Candidatus Baltobacteraceae bacterium]|nr:undecaprenyldiphospho-muramoylpentapeptide beta-N-acetylglucosaminyltransferase [Candidatus Baltobacteraceae bacterium]